jgi:hypothetical protein
MRVESEPQSWEAFDACMDEAEAAMEPILRAGGKFLWSDLDSQRAQQVRDGQVGAQFWTGQAPVKVPGGLIHDWIGALSFLVRPSR